MKKNRIKIYAASLLLFLASGVSAQENFVIGEFTVSEILDGDTFKFERLDRPARLIGIDTEETFKKDDAELRTREIAGYWSEYYAHKKDSSGKPAKLESPFGYKTWQWTKDFLDDVVKVRLESDDAKRNTDMYDRYLVYVIAIRTDGTEFNYNIECVKHGYSPYFNKYGNSARFHDSFIMAQQYAQESGLSRKAGVVG
jgi:endonuclease YncB( thermonuclease family)